MPFGVAVRRMLSDSAADGEPLGARERRFAGAVEPVARRSGRDPRQGIAQGTGTSLRHGLCAARGRGARIASRTGYGPEGARLYVIGRFVRRQRVLVASIAAVLVAIVAGLVGVTWQAREAVQQAARAELKAGKATAVKDFLLDIFKQSSVQNPGGVEARKVTAEQLLAVGATRITSQLREQPEVREELMDRWRSQPRPGGSPIAPRRWRRIISRRRNERTGGPSERGFGQTRSASGHEPRRSR